MYAINFKPAQLDVICHQLHTAWTHMAQQKMIEPGVRPVIAHSWQRCMEIGVPLDRYFFPASPSGPAFAQDAKLLDTAKPILAQFYRYIEGSGFLITLTNSDGIILEVIGDRPIVNSGYRQNVMPGADFSEAKAGTNAMGTCLVNQSPVQLIGAEHYCTAGHDCTSAGAPIRDPLTKKLLGSVSISGKINLAHAHNLGMVVAIARLIEQQLQQSQLQLLHKIVFDNAADGIIITRQDGTVTSVNSRALEILELPIARPEDLTTLSMVPELDLIFQAGISQKTVSRKLTGLGNSINEVELTLTPVVLGELTTGAVLVLKNVPRLSSADLPDHSVKSVSAPEAIITNAPQMQKVLRVAQIAAANQANVLILGESGTGKELMAKAIHEQSPWHDGPFIPVNCGCIPRELIASELFGYTEGSFTGALKKGKKGKFECAAGGTLFLDEIGEMPADMQVALLRVLEERYFYPVGSEKGYPVTCRVIAATNHNLKADIESGKFRADLYYRLNLLSLHLPSLRQRPEDILLLTEFFLNRFARKITDLEPEIKDLLTRYPWPGNVRELKNTVERLVYLSCGSQITKEMLADELLAFSEVSELAKNSSPATEIDVIRKVLQDSSNNHTETAKKLGISRATLYRKLKKLQII